MSDTEAPIPMDRHSDIDSTMYWTTDVTWGLAPRPPSPRSEPARPISPMKNR